MTPRTLLKRSLRHHWRMHAALVLCAAAATATLTGALVVGDSMRGSLRDNALRRLGPVHHAMRSPRFIRTESTDATGGAGVILIQGGIEHAEKKMRANRVQIVGATDSFWTMWPGRSQSTNAAATSPAMNSEAPTGRTVVLNRSLADELGATVGDDVLLRIARQAVVPAESVLGRPDEAAASLRLTVSGIEDDSGVGGFSLDSSQASPFNAFVPLEEIQRAIDRPGRINAILVESQNSSTQTRGRITDELDARLAKALTLADYDLMIRIDEKREYLSLESERMLIEPAVEKAAWESVYKAFGSREAILAYLANSIEQIDADGKSTASIPYSIAAAVGKIRDYRVSGATIEAGEPGGTDQQIDDYEILLNQWAADDLAARVGDTIRLTYYVSGAAGTLETKSRDFKLKAVLPMTDDVVDPGYLPPYRGISDSDTLADWNPPTNFKIDLKRVRPKDEDYWKQYKGSPKAFVSIQAGQAMWTERDSRFGRITSIRVKPTNPDLSVAAHEFTGHLLNHLSPQSMGLAFEDVRSRASAAGAGSTDFGMLFISFSFFIIASAAMLAALVFRLNLERRAGEVGLLAAVGWSHKAVARLFLAEGAMIAAAGSVIGLALAAGYAWLMLAGLRTLWAGAVSAPFLAMHVTPATLAIGFLSGLVVALISLRFAMHGMVQHSPRELLAGAVSSDRIPTGRRRVAPILCIVSIALGAGAIAVSLASDAIPQTAAFFGGGAALLIGGVAGLAWRLSGKSRSDIRRGGPMAVARLGLRNATRQRGRSLTTAGLIAFATFVVVSVGASRHGTDDSALEKTGGAGGYELLVESSVPLPFDPGTVTGREELGLSPETDRLLSSAAIVPMRLKPGDDASCLNLYQVARPQILGAPRSFIERGGFTFAKSLAETAVDRANPWMLLEQKFVDGAIPVIGDDNTMTWLLKIGLGDDFEITDDLGRPQRLRVVGALAGSTLQGELVVGETHFKAMFPGVSGYGFCLIDSGAADERKLSESLERELARYGADASFSIDRLNRFRAVENTYMSAFQSLGGVGLMLGTLGLAAVMLRNVIERRGELALLRAVGFARSRLGLMVLAENAALLICGLLIGGLAALIAVSPNAVTRPGDTDWVSLGLTILGVLVVGMASALLAVRSAVRSPLISSLRKE